MGFVRLFLPVLMLASGAPLLQAELPPVKAVFVIVMENLNWADIEGNSRAPYINRTLLPMASYCRQYFSPSGMHPSLPNYLWLEAGTNFGIYDDADPVFHHQPTTNHFTSLLDRAGISWRAYQEDISGADVPLVSTNGYTPRHNPFVYFDDVTGTNNPSDPYGIAHIRPYSELIDDLLNDTVARYNFITPNLCNDMHNGCAPSYDAIAQGDAWLANEIPKILNSPAYHNEGALFIMWDESDYVVDGSIGMILLSPNSRAPGYVSNVPYSHSSFLRTLQEIFQVFPLLGDAANSPPMVDLFAGLRVELPCRLTNGEVQVAVTGVKPARVYEIHASHDLSHWTCLSTNVASSNSFTAIDPYASNAASRFYRVRQLAP